MDRIAFGSRPSPLALAGVLLFAGMVLATAASLRGWEYDEGYTVFLSAGTARPDWPDRPFRAGEMRAAYAGHSTPLQIARDLRATDVHPPLYFWAVAAWRGVAGTSLFATRLFSVLCSTAALACLAGLCLCLGVPPVATLLLTLGCYGFAYTGAIARGFALAHLFVVAGLWLAAGAVRPARALLAGVTLGAAMLTNYLAAFTGAGALLWLLVQWWRRPAVWLAGGVGFAVWLPAALFFFLAQRDSRTGQFPPFELLRGLARLARYAVASVFGGLPLYVDGSGRSLLAACLAALFAAALLLIVLRWRRITRPDSRALLALTAIATPIGLVALGIVFDTTPIELRYLAFALPSFAALAAAALATLRPAGRDAALLLVLAIDAVSLAGMMTRPETMQPQQATAQAAAALAGPDGLVLVPFGNDGVGVLGAVVGTVPDATRLLAVPAGADVDTLARRLRDEHRVVLAPIGVDADSRAALPPMERAVSGACWRSAGARDGAEAFERTC